MNRTNKIALIISLLGLCASLAGVYRWTIPAFAAGGAFAAKAKAACTATPGCTKVGTYTARNAEGEIGTTALFTLSRGKEKGAQRPALPQSVADELKSTAEEGSVWFAKYRRIAKVEVRYDR